MAQGEPRFQIWKAQTQIPIWKSQTNQKFKIWRSEPGLQLVTTNSATLEDPELQLVTTNSATLGPDPRGYNQLQPTLEPRVTIL